MNDHAFDLEIAALTTAYNALRGLPIDAQERAFVYLRARLTDEAQQRKAALIAQERAEKTQAPA